MQDDLSTEALEEVEASDLPDSAITSPSLSMSLTSFIDEFGDELLSSLHRSNPPIYTGQSRPDRRRLLASLIRQPFPAQAEVVHAAAELLINRAEPAVVINAEMGTGKTLMGIAVAAILNSEGYRRTLVLCPPHLVYKWRREIRETVPGAKVWILNGPDTLMKLLTLREQLNVPPDGQEFFVMGRVRMRLGFHWRPAFSRRVRVKGGPQVATCPQCGAIVATSDGNPISVEVLETEESRRVCLECRAPLWTLMRPKALAGTARSHAVLKALVSIPTIGAKTADRLINTFGEEMLAGMLADNVHEFINLMDARGNLVFSDRQAHRMERSLANLEFSFGEGGYQPSEFVKRYLPHSAFDIMIADEAHEYKALSSAQGQAMGVLASRVRKVVLLTGTLMGGYGDDIFYLLFRALPSRMIEEGYRPSRRGSLVPAGLAFMRDHGVLKDIYSQHTDGSHKTSRGSKVSVRTVKAPGFGPAGILRCVLPITLFLRLRDIGGNVLPPYREEFREVNTSAEQGSYYRSLESTLKSILKQALRRRDTTLLGVVLNVLLAWPDCCFRPETVRHPRSKAVLAAVPSIFGDLEMAPKERELVEICRQEKARGRKVLIYSIYTGTRDTTSRLKAILQREGIKVAVLRASVDTAHREDWIAEQLDRGVDAVITNPELVKTGLDLLEFPTIVYMQSGYNVYTLMQASRRSWRIGQKQPVWVIFLGYAGTSQIACLGLMARKIAVSQSTSGEVPESGLEVLNPDGDSVEIALARQLVA
jgi:SNF2 family DNA or RNA helicase